MSIIVVNLISEL